METNTPAPRKRIGFLRKDEQEVETAVVKAETAATEAAKVPEIPMTNAQADLLETINNLADIIVDKDFATFSEKQRQNFVSQLMNSVALNAELTVKTTLLLA